MKILSDIEINECSDINPLVDLKEFLEENSLNLRGKEPLLSEVLYIKSRVVDYRIRQLITENIVVFPSNLNSETIIFNGLGNDKDITVSVSTKQGLSTKKGNSEICVLLLDDELSNILFSGIGLNNLNPNKVYSFIELQCHFSFSIKLK